MTGKPVHKTGTADSQQDQAGVDDRGGPWEPPPDDSAYGSGLGLAICELRGLRAVGVAPEGRERLPVVAGVEVAEGNVHATGCGRSLAVEHIENRQICMTKQAGA